MAGCDYISCSECGQRLIYDGENHIRTILNDSYNVDGITCSKCVSKLKKKIETLQKFDKRKH